MNTAKKFLRLPAVIEMVGIQRTAIYERIKAGTFPKPISLGPRAVVWDSSEIAGWQEQCIALARSRTHN
ncbi:helix-turn-helix transcriptional regulator [Massilia scottii]|uniref:helix-turn-helix transcriptional regulator n=1 Tax=Massilia scottii TaxID=3057166 RepID=UPI002796D262|nr:AlpA family transcriptional regulator [Massilia sp. CCM 9029]MDQ1831942.1 AlpA family transcriptional regulator [Massilia sp. CCM 9029]